MDGELYAVTIDVDALRARLSRLGCSVPTRDDACAWLNARGFFETKWPGVYIGDPRAIDHLDPAEVVSAKPMGS